MRLLFKVGLTVTVIFLLFSTVGLFIADWERPPMEQEQLGFRGTGIVQITNPRLKAETAGNVVLPEVVDAADAAGPRARQVYQNVQVLGDLSEGQFLRLMTAITEWVSPEQGCNYCHNPENLAEDVPTKIISRRMFQMTKAVNQNWTNHVGQTGVTCYTCHRGQPVPGEIWFRGSSGQPPMGGLVGYDGGQNKPGENVNLSSLPLDPFSEQLDSPEEVRVVGTTPLPVRQGPSIMKTEYTYALMMHMSQSLGVNCVYCHNSRAFAAWDQSSPTRQVAWHAIRMIRELNQSYINPLTPIFAKDKLGPLGDAPKTNCGTCHRGQAKPLGGAPMLRDYPELNATILTPVAGAGPTAPVEEPRRPVPDTPVGRLAPAAPPADTPPPAQEPGRPPSQTR